MSYTVDCDICGRFRAGPLTLCARCGLNVCDRCEYGQAGVGHEMAEHANEIGHELGADVGWDENDERWNA